MQGAESRSVLCSVARVPPVLVQLLSTPALDPMRNSLALA